MRRPIDVHRVDALSNKRNRGSAVPSRGETRPILSTGPSLTFSRWNFLASRRLVRGVRFARRNFATRPNAPLRGGKPIVRALPSERPPPNEPVGTPLPDSRSELPPVIRRAEVVAFALVALLIICVVAVLYAAKAFFLPVVTAFVVGTMLSPAAGFLERHRIPRAVSAVLVVSAVGAAAAFIVGLISSPLMEWSTRLPELGSQLKDKLHVFDRPLALWQELQGMLGGSDVFSTAPFQMPKFDWVQPTIEFLSPTFTEFLLFFATLVLFIASWKDLRRALIMTFADHASRLRTLRILNEIEEHLGGYLLTVTMINLGVGVATGIICALTGMPNAAGLGALAATLNFFPIIGPVAMFVILTLVGMIAFSTLSAGLMAPLAFVGLTFLEGHFVTPTIIGRRLQLNALAVFIALAFWTWLWGPMGGFLSSPLLIVALILKDHLLPVDSPQLPPD
jgi:predicted PurR-regulated permease PerM